jgi:hypothetical protein
MDYDSDGNLDLFVATYVDLDMEKLTKPGENPNCSYKDVPVNCGPRGLPLGRCFLFHNHQGGPWGDQGGRDDRVDSHGTVMGCSARKRRVNTLNALFLG